MEKKVNETVGKICQNCMFGCFKTNCSRADWCKESYPEGHYGKDEKCPMEQFKAIKPKDMPKTTLGPKRDVTIRETWLVCQQCVFSEVKNNTISIDSAFEAHCMDCPNRSLRECLEESHAESIMS